MKEYKKYWGNGNLWIDATRNKNDKYQGIYKEYLVGGTLDQERYYEDGIMQGVQYYFYENGNVYSETNYIDGHINGITNYYNSDGSVKSEYFHLLDGNWWRNYSPMKKMPNKTILECYENGDIEAVKELCKMHRYLFNEEHGCFWKILKPAKETL